MVEIKGDNKGKYFDAYCGAYHNLKIQVIIIFNEKTESYKTLITWYSKYKAKF